MTDVSNFNIDLVVVRTGYTGLRIWPTSHRIRGVTWPTPYTACNYS
jgi:hypothetical protein